MHSKRVEVLITALGVLALRAVDLYADDRQALTNLGFSRLQTSRCLNKSNLDPDLKKGSPLLGPQSFCWPEDARVPMSARVLAETKVKPRQFEAAGKERAAAEFFLAWGFDLTRNYSFLNRVVFSDLVSSPTLIVDSESDELVAVIPRSIRMSEPPKAWKLSPFSQAMKEIERQYLGLQTSHITVSMGKDVTTKLSLLECALRDPAGIIYFAMKVEGQCNGVGLAAEELDSGKNRRAPCATLKSDGSVQTAKTAVNRSPAISPPTVVKEVGDAAQIRKAIDPKDLVEGVLVKFDEKMAQMYGEFKTPSSMPKPPGLREQLDLLRKSGIEIGVATIAVKGKVVDPADLLPKNTIPMMIGLGPDFVQKAKELGVDSSELSQALMLQGSVAMSVLSDYSSTHEIPDGKMPVIDPLGNGEVIVKDVPEGMVFDKNTGALFPKGVMIYGMPIEGSNPSSSTQGL